MPPRDPDLARDLAHRFHAGQVDKGGAPYTQHLAAVADGVDQDTLGAQDSTLAQIGWLHDVLEDTPATPEDLLEAGVPPHVVRAVGRLTRPEVSKQTYQEWIETLARGHDQDEDWVSVSTKGGGCMSAPAAPLVKVADLAHNLREDRAFPAREGHARCSLRRRYIRALSTLLGEFDQWGALPAARIVVDRVNPGLLEWEGVSLS